MSIPSPEKLVNGQRTLDILAEELDIVGIEFSQRPNGMVLYVNLNGITVLRICRIGPEQVYLLDLGNLVLDEAYWAAEDKSTSSEERG